MGAWTKRRVWGPKKGLGDFTRDGNHKNWSCSILVKSKLSSTSEESTKLILAWYPGSVLDKLPIGVARRALHVLLAYNLFTRSSMKVRRSFNQPLSRLWDWQWHVSDLPRSMTGRKIEKRRPEFWPMHMQLGSFIVYILKSLCNSFKESVASRDGLDKSQIFFLSSKWEHTNLAPPSARALGLRPIANLCVSVGQHCVQWWKTITPAWQDI